MVKIVTDSTSDVPEPIARQLGISVVPMLVEIDGTTYSDGVTLSRKQFYDGLNTYRYMPKTAASAVSEFSRCYIAAHQQGADEIISIHLNRKLSAVCSVAEVAAREVSQDGVGVRVVDSETTSMGLGWLAIKAAQMAQQSISAEEIIHWVEKQRSHVIVYALIDTLKYLRRSGRANALVAGIGDMLHIKILITLQKGAISQIDRIHSRKRGIAGLIEIAHTHRNLLHLSVLYTSEGMDSDIHGIQQQLQDLVPLQEQFVCQVNPVLGAHVGPMALGLALAVDI